MLFRKSMSIFLLFFLQYNMVISEMHSQMSVNSQIIVKLFQHLVVKQNVAMLPLSAAGTGLVKQS